MASRNTKTVLAASLAVVATCALLLVWQHRAVELLEEAVTTETARKEIPGMQRITEKRPSGQLIRESINRPPRKGTKRWLEEFKQMGGDPDYESDPWVSGGLTYQVQTWCEIGEGTPACKARHDDAVAEAMIQFPPD